MRFKIRGYKDQDYKLISSWWRMHDMQAPLREMLPEDSTFVLEYEGQPILCVTVYLLNVLSHAWVDNFISHPGAKGRMRQKATKELQLYLERFARDLGVKQLFCFSEKEPLQNYYAKLGYRETLKNVRTFAKELR